MSADGTGFINLKFQLLQEEEKKMGNKCDVIGTESRDDENLSSANLFCRIQATMRNIRDH
jgi:hypothetical protein